MKIKLIFFFVFLEIASLLAQNTDVSIVEEAQDYFEKNYYEESLELLINFEKNNSLTNRGLFLKGLNLYQLNRLALAEEVFSSLFINQEQPFYAEVWLYLAKINHHQHEFEDAAKYYKTYIRSIGDDENLKKSIIEEIRRCSNGRKEKYSISGNFVENLGSQVNSSEDEFSPLESGKGSTELYFSAMASKNAGGKREGNGKINEWEGKFYADMYRTTNSSGKWTAPNSLHFLLNTPQHEVLIGFDHENQTMYFFRGNTLEGGAIMKSNYASSEDLGEQSNPFFSSPWLTVREGGFQVFNQTTVFFAARLPEGFGGSDLYYSVFSKGKWSAPINLGPEINSPFDEVHPFLSLDGKTLFYSTNNSRWSVGGYDIVQQVYDKEINEWSPVISLGIPINSAGDDIQFHLARDGFTGYFASNRRTGFGKNDLYVTYLGNSLGGKKNNDLGFLRPAESLVTVRKEESTFEKEKEEENSIEKREENFEVKVVPKIENSYQEEEKIVLKSEVFKKEKEDTKRIEAERQSVVSRKMEQEPPTNPPTQLGTKELELPILLRSIETETAEFLKEIFRELPQNRSGFIQLTFSVRNRVPLYEHYRQGEQAANQIVQFLIGLGIPSNKIGYRINLNPTIPNEKIQMNYNWRDIEGLPLENSEYYSEDPFSIRKIDIPFYYKVSLSGASELKNAALINNYSNPTLEVSPDGKVTFNAGKFRTYEAALSFAQQLIDNGLTELNVVSYIYDIKATDRSIRQFIHLFPDFSNYLNQKR